MPGSDERDSGCRWVPAAVLARVRETDHGGRAAPPRAGARGRRTGLPLSSWRHVRAGTRLDVLTRQRATMLFGRLRVWDTALNNGVLVYLLMVERRIELLADRALAERVPPDMAVVGEPARPGAGRQAVRGQAAIGRGRGGRGAGAPLAAVAGQAHPESPDAPLRL